PSAVSRNWFHQRTISENSMSAQIQPPMKNHQLYSVLWKWSERPIDRSQESTDQPKAKKTTCSTAIQPCRECVEWISRRSSPKPSRIRARRFAAQPAPASGTRPTSRRTDVYMYQMPQTVNNPKTK